MSDGQALLLAAGYDTSIHHSEVALGAGPRGQAVFVQRMPVTFRENANRSRTVAFPVYAHWMGKIRELGIGPIQEPMRRDLATGNYALITNNTDISIQGDVGWPETVECRFYVGKWYGRADATVDLFNDWIRVSKTDQGSVIRHKVASSKMTMTWARVTGHGLVEPVPPPAYFQNFIDLMGQTTLDPSLVTPDFSSEPLLKLSPAAQSLFEAPPSPRLKTIVCERRFETTQEESNIVGNVYFSNYFIWQGRVRDYFISRVMPDVFKVFGSASTAEPVCLLTSVHHLREAMPFDTIVVTMAVREITTHHARLYFEYFREEADRSRTKLAVGEHQLAWAQRDNGEPVMMPLPAALTQALQNFDQPIR